MRVRTVRLEGGWPVSRRICPPSSNVAEPPATYVWELICRTKVTSVVAGRAGAARSPRNAPWSAGTPAEACAPYQTLTEKPDAAAPDDAGKVAPAV
jgi:hypothetical protein